MDTKEAIRRALQYAISDRVQYFYAVNHADPVEAAVARDEVIMFGKILKRRYGQESYGNETIPK